MGELINKLYCIVLYVQARTNPQVQSQNDILNFKSVDISKQRPAILSNELFRGNS